MTRLERDLGRTLPLLPARIPASPRNFASERTAGAPVPMDPKFHVRTSPDTSVTSYQLTTKQINKYALCGLYGPEVQRDALFLERLAKARKELREERGQRKPVSLHDIL